MKRTITILAFVLAAMTYGCGGGSGNSETSTAEGPPSPDSPRAHQGQGVPLTLFGSGRNLRNQPGAEDAEYQEYLLWREWQEYQRYQDWRRLQSNIETDQGGEQQEASDQ